jgi:hypothetical protein
MHNNEGAPMTESKYAVPEDFVEVTEQMFYEEWQAEPDRVKCAKCDERVGGWWTCDDYNPDVDRLVFAEAWLLPDESVVCEECKDKMLTDAELSTAQLDAVLAAIEAADVPGEV